MEYVKYQLPFAHHGLYWVPMGLSLFYHTIIFAKCYLAFHGIIAYKICQIDQDIFYFSISSTIDFGEDFSSKFLS